MTYVRQTKSDMAKKFTLYGLAAVGIAAVVFGGIFLLTGKKQPVPLTGSVIQKEQGTIQIVRASRDVNAGEAADAAKFEIIAVPKELVPANAITSISQLNGKRVANPMTAKEFLLLSDLMNSADWYEDGDRLMEHTFQDGAIPATVNVGSVVDIKLFKAKNQDNVVISKATVIGKMDKTLSFYLNEAEQEYIKEASTEGTLFLVQYLDKTQTPSIVTYQPEYSHRAYDSFTRIKNE